MTARSPAFGGRATPPVVVQPAYSTDLLSEYAVGQTLGSFLGFLRRSKSTKHGLTAQIFGENGNDADFITTLHLTKFLDAPVKVSVWMIKDKDGRMAAKGGEPPLLTDFIARVQRPLAGPMGQVAQLFGENGPNADAVNKLNETRYLDALVLVELQKAEPGMVASDIATSVSSEDVQAGQKRLTVEEENVLKRHQKRADQAMTALRQHGFFQNELVLRALGPEESYLQWLTSQRCCQPGTLPCPHSPVVALPVVNGRQRTYSAVPLCVDHRDAWASDSPPDVAVTGGGAFLATQAMQYKQRWAQDMLRQQMNVPAGFLPSPGLIFSWASDRRLNGYLPAGFEQFLQSS